MDDGENAMFSSIPATPTSSDILLVVVQGVSEKPFRFIFDDNSSRNCRITVITHRRKIASFSHLTYLMHLSYLGNCQTLKIVNLVSVADFPSAVMFTYQ